MFERLNPFNKVGPLKEEWEGNVQTLNSNLQYVHHKIEEKEDPSSCSSLVDLIKKDVITLEKTLEKIESNITKLQEPNSCWDKIYKASPPLYRVSRILYKSILPLITFIGFAAGTVVLIEEKVSSLTECKEQGKSWIAISSIIVAAFSSAVIYISSLFSQKRDKNLAKLLELRNRANILNVAKFYVEVLEGFETGDGYDECDAPNMTSIEEGSSLLESSIVPKAPQARYTHHSHWIGLREAIKIAGKQLPKTQDPVLTDVTLIV